MATHRRKVVEVEARKWEGPGTMAVYHKVKGDQTAKKGDWLVGPDDAERGDIEVVKKEDFERDYEPIEPEHADATLDENVIGNADGGYDTTETAEPETEE